jgi:hypothetical protein
MPLPPEIAAVREAGELLLRNGHEAVGARILDWVDGGCVGSRDFFRLKVNGRDWVKEVRKAQSDDLIRNAAALLGIAELDRTATVMTRRFTDYYEQQWLPQTRGAESCPHADGSFEALLWQAQRLQTRQPFRRIIMRAILASGWTASSPSFAPSPSSKKLPPRQQKADQDAEADSPQ